MTEQPIPVVAGRRKKRLPISVPGMASAPQELFESDSQQSSSSVGDRNGTGTHPASTSRDDRRLDPRPCQPISKVAMFGVAGAILLAICLSPFGMGQLAFLAIAPWAWLTLDARRISPASYAILYACGWITWVWLLVIEVDLGHGALFRELPLIGYLAIYVPLFIWLGRAARMQLRLPAFLVLPVIWCGLEWLRCHLFGGFSLGLLAHAAADTRRVLQLTDVMGSYGLGMLMVASGASLAELLWVTRRIRLLERRLPQAPTEEPSDSAVFTSSNRFLSGGFQGQPMKKADARTSLEAAMRRSRDYARDVHLMSVTLLVMVIVGVLVFANSYGRSRVLETRTWKLFESNLFSITVLGGSDSTQVPIADPPRPRTSLLVACLNQPQQTTDWRPPVLWVTPDAESSGWKATLYRSQHEGEYHDLAFSPADSAFQWTGLPQRPACLFPSQLANVPLNLLVTLSPTVNTEQAVNDRLRSEPSRGKGIDVTVVMIQPGSLDGSLWPRLLTRSVIAAAVANRCPVIACVPGRMSAVANGDGDLWWSTALPADSSQGDSLAHGQSTNDPIQVQAMIDPRVSYFVASLGDLPAMICFLLTLAIPVLTLVRTRRRRNSKVRQPARQRDTNRGARTVGLHG